MRPAVPAVHENDLSREHTLPLLRRRRGVAKRGRQRAKKLCGRVPVLGAIRRKNRFHIRLVVRQEAVVMLVLRRQDANARREFGVLGRAGAEQRGECRQESRARGVEDTTHEVLTELVLLLSLEI
jgi:hypothetical protein